MKNGSSNHSVVNTKPHTISDKKQMHQSSWLHDFQSKLKQAKGASLIPSRFDDEMTSRQILELKSAKEILQRNKEILTDQNESRQKRKFFQQNENEFSNTIYDHLN
jgi:hypothetical protein